MIELAFQAIKTALGLGMETEGFPSGSDGKESAYNAGDPGSIPGSGRSLGEGNGYPLQYSCLENSMDRGAWRAPIHRVTESEGHRVRHDWVTNAFISMDTEDTYKNQWVRILQILIGPLPHRITTKDIPTTFYVASC